jgi:hypothetical protein
MFSVHDARILMHQQVLTLCRAELGPMAQHFVKCKLLKKFLLQKIWKINVIDGHFLSNILLIPVNPKKAVL